MEPLVLGPHAPKEWMVCRVCGMELVHRVTNNNWSCAHCNQRYVIYRSGKVYKWIDSETYWTRFDRRDA
jgi:ribosomal protein L37AE/L43A